MSTDFGKILYVIDKDYNIVNMNNVAKAVFPDIRLGMKCYELRGESAPCLTCPVRTGNPVDKVVYTDKDGINYYVSFANMITPDGSERIAICPNADIIENKSAEQEITLMRKKMFAYRQANYDLAYMYFEVNLSKDLITSDICEVVDYVESVLDMSSKGLKKPIAYSAYHKMRLINKVLSCRDEYKAMADPKHLIELFHQGQNIVELTFRARSTSGYLTWHKQSIYMFKGELTDDVWALYVIRDVNHQLDIQKSAKRNEEIMKILACEYSAVFYVELETGLVSLCNLPMALDKDFKNAIQNSTYPELWRSYVTSRVLNADAQKLLRFTDPEYLKSVLRDKKSYAYLYRVGDEENYKYYEMKLVKSEEGEPKSFVLGIADKDDVIRTQQEQEHQLELALIMAQKDSLTGVRNRTAYDIAEKKLDQEIKSGKKSEFAVVMFDVNGLKKANDIYGHEKGNLLLINSVKLICDTFKHSQVFRIGGDEFVCILIGEDYANRDKLMNRIRATIRKNEQKGDPIYINVSIASGIAVYDNQIDKNTNSVFQRADKLMYETKARMKAKRQKKILY